MSNEKQVTDNLDTFESFQVLNETELKAVTAVSAAMKKRVKNGCTGCSYCMPCPSGVNIPENFSIWNNHGIYRNPGETKWLLSNNLKEETKAKNCIECGNCEAMCPQKISIREDLKTLQAELDAVVNR
jgi:predicted aldo/keto reductase-like oxidoreductase